MAGGGWSLVRHDSLHGPAQQSWDSARLDKLSPAQGLLRVQYQLDLQGLQVLPLRRRGSSRADI